MLISLSMSRMCSEMAIFFYFKSKKGGKNQESIQSSTTPDPGYHMGILVAIFVNIATVKPKLMPDFYTSAIVLIKQ